jgi:hypothetical protein
MQNAFSWKNQTKGIFFRSAQTAALYVRAGAFSQPRSARFASLAFSPGLSAR